MTTKAAYSNKALPPGTVLREWRLEQVLGVGGFGIVYKGRGIYFDELVAIKEYFPSAISERRDGDTVVPTDSDSEEIHALGLKKFVEEAKLLWNLSKPTRHPNIVSVRSLFEIHGTAYMVMDFEDGLSLSQMLKEGKSFTEQSLSGLIRPISEGLDRAHRVGVLHRDIKPPNILVSEDGRPVLIDFGSARFDAGQATSTKVTFHTPPYAAIEQYVKTYDQGPWTDVYALGVVLYECITGEKPPEVLERMHGGLGTDLAHGDWPGYSRPFLRAVDAAMTIRPSDRPQSIPQWLAMFDADDDAPLVMGAGATDDTATRFAEFKTLPDEILPVAQPLPKVAEPEEKPAEVGKPADEAKSPAQPAKVADDEKEPAKEKAKEKSNEKPKDKPRRGLRPIPIAIAASALLAVAGGAWVFWPHKQTNIAALPGLPNSDVAVLGDATQNGTAPLPTDAVAPQDLPAALDSLVAEARRAGRPAGGLAAASAKLKTLAAEMATLATQPQSGPAVQEHQDQMKSVTIAASADFAGAMVRDADQKSRQMVASLPAVDPTGSPAAAKAAADIKAATAVMNQAKGRISSAAAAARSAPGPNEAIAAARQGIAAYSQLNSAYAKAYRASQAGQAVREDTNALPKRREEFMAVDGSARAIYQRIVDMARGGKPGLFASSEKRDAYRTRQDNAAKAKTYLGELDNLVRSMQAATTVGAVDSLMGQVKSVKSNLASLEASSSAATGGKGTQSPAATSNGND
jgi:non-specific serine/threonine protein kinase